MCFFWYGFSLLTLFLLVWWKFRLMNVFQLPMGMCVYSCLCACVLKHFTQLKVGNQFFWHNLFPFAHRLARVYGLHDCSTYIFLPTSSPQFTSVSRSFCSVFFSLISNRRPKTPYTLANVCMSDDDLSWMRFDLRVVTVVFSSVYSFTSCI